MALGQCHLIPLAVAAHAVVQRKETRGDIHDHGVRHCGGYPLVFINSSQLAGQVAGRSTERGVVVEPSLFFLSLCRAG